MSAIIIIAVMIAVILTLFLLSANKQYLNNGCETAIYKIHYGPGPTIGLIGGVHGNEPAGAVAFSQLIDGQWVLPPSLQVGTYIIIPRANLCGLIKGVRYQSTQYNKDLNRNFAEDGPLDNNSQKILEAFRECDFIIDIHEGYAYHKTTPQSVGPTLAPTTPLSENIAENAVNAINQYILADYKKFTNLHYEDCAIKNTLSCYMRNRNRHYILIEISGQNDLQPMDLRVWQAKYLTEHILSDYLGRKN